jgi:hypothetical protein
MSSLVADSITDVVHLGSWTNWSYGPIRGATITLTRSHGGLLTTFLALFVTFAGTCFWQLLCFCIHHWLSSEVPQDAIYHQRQAILRNAANGQTGLRNLIRLAWVWRQHGRRTYHRLVPLILITFILTTAFTIAGLFSSWVSSTRGNEVLLEGSHCGLFGVDSDIDTYNNRFAQTTTGSADYAQRCYSSNASSTECPTFAVPRLPYTINRSAECPFEPSICQDQNLNVKIDTGYINSHDHLGINSPVKRRFLYRSITQCAPLKTEGYSDRINHTYESIEREWIRFFYGNRGRGEGNATYLYPALNPGHYSVAVNMTSSSGGDYTLT